MGLRPRLFLLVLLALVPALTLTLYGSAERRRLEAQDTQREALRVARLASASQERVVDGAHQLLQALARLPALRGGGSDCASILAEFLVDNEAYLNLLVTDAAGQVICSGVPQTGSVSLGDRPYFQRLLVSRRLEVSEYQLSRTTGRHSIAVGLPLSSEGGAFVGALVAALDLDWLNRLAADAEMPAGSTLTVLDRDGTILARYPDPQTWVGRAVPDAPLVRAIRERGAEGTVEATGLDGVARLYAFTSLGGAAVASGGHVAVGVPRAIAFAEADRALARNLGGLSLAAALALAAIWFGGGLFVVRPVATLVRAAERLSGGDLTVRSGLDGGAGEIGRLGRAFDAMAASLERSEAERAEKLRLEQENIRIAELDRLKSEFVNLVSHELRTPLTAIKGYARLLEEGSGLSPLERAHVGVIRSSADRLIALISDLLDVARIEAGRLELRRESVDLAAAVWEVVQLLEGVVEARGHALDLELPEDLPPVDADPARLIQILTNLVSNAVAYTPAHGSLLIRAARASDDVRVDVVDNGVGMTDDELAQLFTRFFRARHPATAAGEGTGLGLVITRALIELHGGQLSVTSAQGRGTTMSFTLPLASPSPG